MGEARPFPCLMRVLLGHLPTSVRWAQHLLAPSTQLNPSTLEEGKEEGCSPALPSKAERHHWWSAWPARPCSKPQFLPGHPFPPWVYSLFEGPVTSLRRERQAQGMAYSGCKTSSPQGTFFSSGRICGEFLRNHPTPCVVYISYAYGKVCIFQGYSLANVHKLKTSCLAPI